MVNIARVKVEWSGAGVTGGGLSQFYSTADGYDLALAVDTMFDGLCAYLPPSVSIHIPAGGEVLDSATGDLVDTWAGAPGSTQPGRSTGPFSIGVGCRIVWETNGRTNNRRVRGSTFLVPLSGAVYDTDGTIAGGMKDIMQGHAETLVSSLSNQLVIWTRPVPASSDPGAPPARAGGVNSVLSVTMPDKVSWLRTRRT